MKKINKNVILLVMVIMTAIFLSGSVTAIDSSDEDMMTESTLLSDSNVVVDTTANEDIPIHNEITNDNGPADTQNSNKTLKSDKLSEIYVNSQASPSSTGADRQNPTTLNNAINNIEDGGIIYLVTDSFTDTYNLTSTITLSRYSNNLNSLNIIGEENKNITISGNNITQILNVYSTTLNISNVNFADTELSISSSIYASSSTINFINCSFTNNYRKDYGSSIYASYSTIYLNGCVFDNNTADYGGAIYLSHSNITIDSTQFTNNQAFSGAAIYALQSNVQSINSTYALNNASFGASIFNYKSNITCNNTRFTNNSALYYGGAVLQLDTGKALVNNSYFIANSALYGGAVYIMQSDLSITSTVFEDNTAQTASSVYSYNNTIGIKNSCLVDNPSNASLVHIMYPKNYLIDDNWWGQNNPDFYKVTGGYIPDTWVLMTFRNYTSNVDGQLNLSVSINQLSSQNTLQSPIPTRKVIFSSDNGIFTQDVMDITTNVSNLYDGNSTVYASIDNQQMQLNAKVIPTILIENYTTSLNNINLTITANKDISGNFNLTINNYTSKLTAKQKTRLYYPISDLNPGEYVINLTYSGNSKYDKTSVYSYLTIQSNEYIQNETITPTLTKAIVNSTSIPSKYSLLDLGLLTPVKSQGSAGSCVSFAAVGVMESALKKLTNITYDLSENNVKNMFKKYSIYGLSGLEPNDGGYDMEPVGYLAGGFGPVLEQIDEYNTQSHISNVFEPLFQAQNVYFIPARKNFTDNNLIKEAIMKYGPVYTGVKLSSNLNQYNIGVNKATHAVCIVGWDDKYSKTNFSPNAPGDGAFIIKNSWGENTGNNGYQYVSYYDSVIGNLPYVNDYNSVNFVVDFDNCYNYSNIYQYDSVCYVYELGDTDGQYWINNSYTIQNDEVISAIGTYFVDASQYEMKVYINNNLVTTKSGKLTQPGYQTIQLDNFYRVKKYDEVMVVIGIKQNISGDKIYVPLHDTEYPVLGTNPKSYISYTGLQYENLQNMDTVAPIKVYTLNVAEFDTQVDIESDMVKFKTDISNLDDDAKLYYKINDEFITDSNGNILYDDINANTSSIELNCDKNTFTTNNVTLETILSYKGLNITKTVQFNPITEIRLEIGNITAYINTKLQLTVNVINQDNEKLNDGYIQFTDVTGKVLAMGDVENGLLIVNITFNKIYDDILTLTYYDDMGKQLAESITNLTIKKHDVIIQMNNMTADAGSTVNLTAKVTDENGENISNGKVVFKINGKTVKDTSGKVLYVKVVDGIASMGYVISSDLAGKDLLVQVAYSGSSIYDSVKNESFISINNLTPSIRCEDITATKSSQITLNAWVNDGNVPITTGKVVFKINGKTVKDANGKVIYAKIVNGFVSVNYTLPDSMNAKNYTLTAVLLSSDYPKLEDTKTLTIME